MDEEQTCRVPVTRVAARVTLRALVGLFEKEELRPAAGTEIASPGCRAYARLCLDRGLCADPCGRSGARFTCEVAAKRKTPAIAGDEIAVPLGGNRILEITGHREFAPSYGEWVNCPLVLVGRRERLNTKNRVVVGIL